MAHKPYPLTALETEMLAALERATLLLEEIDMTPIPVHEFKQVIDKARGSVSKEAAQFTKSVSTIVGDYLCPDGITAEKAMEQICILLDGEPAKE